MTNEQGQVWFITGTSTGFGRSLALEALARGGRVAATARDPERLDPALKRSDRVLRLPLDVTDADRCRRAVAETLAAWGGIDLLVNNAGYGQLGAVEEVSDAEARAVFDTNVFGLLNVLRAALPAMRRAGRGHVVNIGSVGGLLARSGIGIYAATKFAVEGISEALHQELKPLGIGVTVVEPGPFRTDFSGRSLVDSAVTLDAYAKTAGERRAELRGKHGTQQGDPDKAARVIIDAIEAAEPPFHLVLGGPAMARATEKLTALLEEIERWRGPSAATDFD
ncbi:MAG: oxidoreductase [Rhodospirillales bacterium]|jgi:NAD(P)-dependent dehydrogenase (short-subunit alcohol dehydrogenase family)|nr:oxidoreductase [Rhodospirillales bacterium]